MGGGGGESVLDRAVFSRGHVQPFLCTTNVHLQSDLTIHLDYFSSPPSPLLLLPPPSPPRPLLPLPPISSSPQLQTLS